MTSNQDPVDDQREDQGTSQPVVESTVKRSRDDQREDQRTSHPVVESTVKRSRVVDPDYEEISDQPSKRQRVLEEDGEWVQIHIHRVFMRMVESVGRRW